MGIRDLFKSATGLIGQVTHLFCLTFRRLLRDRHLVIINIELSSCSDNPDGNVIPTESKFHQRGAWS